MAHADWSVHSNFRAAKCTAQSGSTFTSTHTIVKERNYIFEFYTRKNLLAQNRRRNSKSSEYFFLNWIIKSGNNVLIYWNGSGYHFLRAFYIGLIDPFVTVIKASICDVFDTFLLYFRIIV